MPDIDIPSVVSYTLAFLLVAMASKQIGAFFSRYGLPYITGYLLAGALAGPFLLEMLPEGAAEDLYFIDDISLAVIAFIAGSELYLKELQDRLRGILLNTAGIATAALILIGVAVYVLSGSIPFIADLPQEARAAAAILGATVLLALSPASTIAVIQEVRAKGPFSKTVLSVTVVMDVVIIILFAVSVALASALIDGDSLNAGFAAILLLDLAIAIGVGYLVSLLIGRVLETSFPTLAKAAIILFIGFVIFEGGFRFTDWTDEALPFKIKIEPLLISMVAGFSITNFTNYRREFEELLHDISPYVYVAFFTLTGVALKLDILFETLGIAMLLFLARMISIAVGSFAGGTLAGEPMRFRRMAWLGLITQAGIALGLAREAAVEFPSLGADFATLIIAVVVLNEIFGPMMLKFALRLVGESQETAPAEPDDRVRDVLILGIQPQTIALARQLTSQGWTVIVADTDIEQLERLAAEDIDERHLPGIACDDLAELISPNTDAVVTMLDDDEANFCVAENARHHFGIRNVIVQPRDIANTESFLSLGARVVDPASAMVNLLDQYIRTPASMELFMHQDPDYDVMQVRVTERDYHGVLLRDLRLPPDVLVLEITRDGHSIVPAGYSALHVGDEVTLVGKPESIREAQLLLGY